MSEQLGVLYGAEAIAAFLNVSPRRVYHLAEKKQIPVFRIGATLCARRSTLIAWVEDMESAALDAQFTSLISQAKRKRMFA